MESSIQRYPQGLSVEIELKENSVQSSQRSKNDPVVLAGIKHTDSSGLDEKIDELVQRTSGLKAAIRQCEDEIKKEAQQSIQFLSENVAMLEAKLKDSERRKKMEEQLTSQIHALQSELDAEKETLQSRDQEIADLKSNAEVLEKQVTEFEIAIKQAKAEAAAEADRAEQLMESLEAQITNSMEIVRGKEATIAALEQKLAAETQDFENELKNKESLLVGRDAKINYLRSNLQMLTGKIQKLSSEADALATIEAQSISTFAASDVLSQVEKKPAKVPSAASNEQTSAAHQIVCPELFDLMRQELAKTIGPQAETILRNSVAAVGESTDSFPKSRLSDLLETVSKEIKNESPRIGFRKWFVKQVR